MTSSSRFRVLVFTTAFFSLMFELIISRVANFHLDFRNSYIALPIAFLGLAIGSLHVHFSRRVRENFSIHRNLYVLAAAVFATLFLVFAVFTQFLSISGVGGYYLHLPLLMTKTALFVVFLVVPFYVFGRILTLCFHLNQEDIGRIYGLDFLGAALACFVTPLLFHWVNLPAVIVALLAAISLMLVAFARLRPGWRVVLALVLCAVNAGFYFAIDYMDRSIHYLYWTTEDDPPETREIASRWNEFSRVQLVEFLYQNTNRNHYKIIHDNARSNVYVRPYRPEDTSAPRILDALEAPFIMGMQPRSVMVMFAGSGAEMVRINQYAGGEAEITGIEINRACADLAAETEELRDYRLGEFYALPHIDMRFQEGRSFLELTDQKFDMVFVGSSAPLALAFTGHTRKYLYTKEAMLRYLDVLAPGGILLFDHQPIARTLDTFRAAFDELGIGDFEQCVVLLRSSGGANRGSPDILIKPDGFSREDVMRLRRFNARAADQLVYTPYTNPAPRWAKLVRNPNLEDVPTDDRPFLEQPDLAGYRVFPEPDKLKDASYFVNWIYITTMLLLMVVTLFFVVAAQFAARERRLPPAILAYLLLTGFVYLIVEIAFIAKLELFLQDALVSMASVISIFLLTSAAGSWSYRQVAGRLGMVWFPLLAAALLGGATLALNHLLPALMDLPLAGRLAVTAAVISPVGWVLGMFYPYAVTMLTKHEKGEAVPITYGISTLSSVIGASYAMTMMMVWGFTALLVQGLAGYLLLAAGVFVYNRTARVSLLR
jgi:hypothetical protein